MRKLIATCILFTFAIAAVAAQRSIDQMKVEADKAEGGRQAKLCAELARQLVPVADQQFTETHVEQAQNTVQEILKYASKARDASINSHGKMKETEIILRETQRKLQELRRTLSVDDRQPLEEVGKKLEQFRQDILNEMFAPPKKKESR